jgi:glycosyltransferase involved in cell wall biosynthesis
MGHFIGYYPEIYTRGEARTRLGLTSEHHTLLYFGQLRRYKNLPYLIGAFRQLPSAHLRLLLVGAPSDRESLDTLREICSADERIRLIAQYVPDNEIQLYMCAADAVLLPFQHILTSSSLVLAMSFGKAAIAPALGCIPELLTAENGILYAPYQPDGLVSALRHTSDIDLDARGQRALHTIAATTWTQAAFQTATLYRDVLDM